MKLRDVEIAEFEIEPEFIEVDERWFDFRELRWRVGKTLVRRARPADPIDDTLLRRIAELEVPSHEINRALRARIRELEVLSHEFNRTARARLAQKGKTK